MKLVLHLQHQLRVVTGPITPQCTDEGGVHSKLRTSELWEANATTTSSLLPFATALGRARACSPTNTLVLTRFSLPHNRCELRRSWPIATRTPCVSLFGGPATHSNGRPHLQHHSVKGRGNCVSAENGQLGSSCGFQLRNPPNRSFKEPDQLQMSLGPHGSHQRCHEFPEHSVNDLDAYVLPNVAVRSQGSRSLGPVTRVRASL